MTKDIEVFVTYNLWANKRIAAWLLSNKAEKLEAPGKSSFPSIISTINHIWDAQIFYLSLIKQVQVSKNWDKTPKGAIDGLLEQSEEFAKYVSTLEVEEIQEPLKVQVRSMSGKFSRAQLIQHCMNHSTYHRGQLITMGHQLGLTKAPSTDLFFYLYRMTT